MPSQTVAIRGQMFDFPIFRLAFANFNEDYFTIKQKICTYFLVGNENLKFVWQ